MEAGLDWNWRFIPELFEMDEIATEAAARGIGADVSLFREDYDRRIRGVLVEATLEAPKDQRPILGGRRGHHSEHLGHLLAPMQYLEIPFATLLGWLVFGDLPNGLAALGIAITIGAGLYIVFRERRAEALPSEA